MDASAVVLIVAAAWIAVGVALAFVMGRRGFSPATWLLLGVGLGPLVFPIALWSLREAGQVHVRRAPSGGDAGSGTVQVLVGVDGSPASEDALRAVRRVFGASLRGITLATVIDLDAAAAARRWESEERAEAALDALAAADTGPGPRASTVVLAGAPAASLVRYASEQGYDLVVVGRRGHGASEALLGSVASKLAHGSDGVPVLIV